MICNMTTSERIAYNEGKRDGAKEVEQRTNKERCEAQGHEWENCCSIVFEIYQRCKWCGEKR